MHTQCLNAYIRRLVGLDIKETFIFKLGIQIKLLLSRIEI